MAAKSKPRGRGRPKKPPGAGLSETVQVRVTFAEYQRIKAAAKAADQDLSPWAREALLRSLKGHG